MSKLKSSYQVAIIGGGPVGLFLAIVLNQHDIGCIVLEKRTERTTHSRSLGIHPVSLELMEKIGLVDRFLEEGIKITKGVAWGDRSKIGTLTFESCPGPYRFVLALPQYRTEHLLEQHLKQVAPDCLVRGAELINVVQYDNSVDLQIRHDNQVNNLSAEILAGCDGKDSIVRQAAGFEFEGKQYPDTYIMGDFSDHTDLGSTANIFLHSDGLIESFPLTEKQRRWVVKTERPIQNVSCKDIERRVLRRTGFDVSGTENSMLSSFGVQRYLARPMADHRIFLAGDAAHIVSPIGGQGMNLGWLDAWELSERLVAIIQESADPTEVGKNYHFSRTKAAKQAIRRAELNMVLGRKSRFPYPKTGLVWLMLNTPLQHLMARIFTMRGLNTWFF